jgi:hypothetical protein
MPGSPCLAPFCPSTGCGAGRASRPAPDAGSVLRLLEGMELPAGDIALVKDRVRLHDPEELRSLSTRDSEVLAACQLVWVGFPHNP